MLEAYDLLPVIDCLKESADWDAVDACMQRFEPWLSVSESSGVSFSDNAINGFIGGTVGVVGTVAATLIKKSQVKDRLKCTYCDGTGQITCGVCLGRGTANVLNDKGEWVMTKCTNCEGTGTVVCINCQGSGMAVPEDFLQVLGDSEMGFSDEDYIGLFDEVKFPTVEPKSETLTEMVNETSQPSSTAKSPASASQSSSSASFKEPFDPTGGVG